jgi:hypothetical protein
VAAACQQQRLWRWQYSNEVNKNNNNNINNTTTNMTTNKTTNMEGE